MARCCRIVLFVLAFCLSRQAYAQAQYATVIFYEHGSELTSGLPGSKHGIFFGAVFDGADRLLVFRSGFFAKNDRYALFRLPPGAHVFSASYSRKASEHGSLKLELAQGKTYFIRAQQETLPSSALLLPLGLGLQRGRVDEVRCPEAEPELRNAKPLPRKAISPHVISEWVDANSIPSCSQANPAASPSSSPPPSSKP